jgi:Prokaryotic E2 family E
VIHPILQAQFAELNDRHPRSELLDQGGAALITVPEIPLLPKGAWNLESTEVLFLAPQGFPHARPDCFWVNGGVRLAHGGQPQNSGPQGVPGKQGQYLWFSWHLSQWDPNRDSLLTYLAVIQQRLRDPR